MYFISVYFKIVHRFIIGELRPFILMYYLSSNPYLDDILYLYSSRYVQF